MSQDDFLKWYAKKEEAAEPQVQDVLVIMKKNGCLNCHTTDGTVEVGPTFKGIFGKTIEVITNGKEHEVVVDEEYLKRSMLEPDANVVKGFDAIMPSQKGVLTDEEINAIIEYIKSLK
jgi:cytochrome c oxidase subunit 2